MVKAGFFLSVCGSNLIKSLAPLLKGEGRASATTHSTLLPSALWCVCVCACAHVRVRLCMSVHALLVGGGGGGWIHLHVFGCMSVCVRWVACFVLDESEQSMKQ